ncbi:MAG TPA: MerR family transcriptional regulator [Acidimicrobiales bacterium]|nr:MerR family transcriptional regulator [Acidimicrobiales bacterium]
MSTYTIGEVATRSGFAASALRYYEDIGLVVPAARTEAGYRVYDDATLGRLAFIARAKGLGCTLEEITDLLTLWDGDACAPLQHRFHALVTAKIAAARRQIDELAAFSAQLDQAAAQLAGPPSDGPCDDGCACVAPLQIGAKPAPAVEVPRDDVPVACTLDPAERAERLAGWRALLGEDTVLGPARHVLDPGTDLGVLGRLVEAERACCPFLGFTLTVDAGGVVLDVTDLSQN